MKPMGSHQKKEKNFTTVVNYGEGSANFGVWTSKKYFFRAYSPKNMLKLIHYVPFVCLHKIQSLNSYKIMWETGVLVLFGKARWIWFRPRRISDLIENSNSTVTNFWPNRKFDQAKLLHCNIKFWSREMKTFHNLFVQSLTLKRSPILFLSIPLIHILWIIAKKYWFSSSESGWNCCWLPLHILYFKTPNSLQNIIFHVKTHLTGK